MKNQLDRIEWKVDQILASLASMNTAHMPRVEVSEKATEEEGQVGNTLYRLTIKQHGTLQMLLDGKSNFDIAQRFGVSEDTAKVYVRTIAKKYGVNTRAQIVGATLEEFNSVSDDVYQRTSGGLPKDWHSTFSEPDPFADLYARKKHEPKSQSER